MFTIPELPFPITATDLTGVMEQMQLLMNAIFEERIGGANLGDVFVIGDDDILAVTLLSTGGLEKSASTLRIKIKADGGLATNVDGIYILAKPSSGIESDDEGTYVETKDDGGISVDDDGLYITEGFYGYPASATASTLSSDTLTVTGTSPMRWHVLTSESGTSDDLSTIAGGTAGEVIMLQPASGHTITAKTGVDNIICPPDFVLNNVNDNMILMKTGSNWIEQSRKSNG